MTGSSTRKRAVRALLSILSVGAAALIIAFLPTIVQVSWGDIIEEFQKLGWVELIALMVLWLAGLWSYTYMLKATMPGLTNLQAFTMNACSSGIGNMLPFGGAAGVAVNFALCRSWGYPRGAVAASVLVSGIWNTLIRLLLPALGLLALLLAGSVPEPALAIPAAIAAIGIIAVAGAAFAALEWDGAAKVIGGWLDWLGTHLPRRIRPEPGQWSAALWRTRTQTSEVIKQQWVRMTAWLVTYFALQAALFIACLVATGAYTTVGFGFAQAFAAFALRSLLTAAAITPGGTGITEAGAITLLTSFGAPHTEATTAALLFWLLIFVLEIPLGAILWAVSAVLTRGPWSPANTAKRVGFTLNGNGYEIAPSSPAEDPPATSRSPASD